MSGWEVYGRIQGPIVLIGFGSIGRGFLPLLERHFQFDRDRMVVIDPDDSHRHLLEERGIAFLQKGLTPENYREVLQPILAANPDEQPFCINSSVDVSSIDLIGLCREREVLYIDTVVEPWFGFYFDTSAGTAARTNYHLRELLLAEKRAYPGTTTAVVCCGANPGMVSWLVKQALVNLSIDLGKGRPEPEGSEEWALLMRELGVKGVHIAERDTQCTNARRPVGVFWNTWSVGGLISEGMQPAELGWGTHEKWKPENAHFHETGCRAAIYLESPGAKTLVRTWCPEHGPQHGFLITHNESISIADYFSLRKDGKVLYRPTCHYAYRPCEEAILSLRELLEREGQQQDLQKVLEQEDVVSGQDELGVLLYGHEKNAYWYGSQLTIEQTRDLVPYQNATALQVTSAILAGMVWALENPRAGIVEAEELDYDRCLEIQKPYLGTVAGYYTDWTPLTHRSSLFDEDLDTEDPWQFRNILVRG